MVTRDPDHDIDIVSVAHREQTWELMHRMFNQVRRHEPERVRVIAWDNRVDNLGFAAGCNAGAALGAAPVIGFLNPDTTVHGSFREQVVETLTQPGVVITGCRFGKPDWELQVWGVRDWACGAAFFVSRDWWEGTGGFDERFFWGWEETDLIRTAERRGYICRSVDLPLLHESPHDDSPEDALIKRRSFERGADLFRQKWGLRR